MYDSEQDPHLALDEDARITLLDIPEPSPEQAAFLAALDAEDLADLNARPDLDTPHPVSPWAVTEALASRARACEVLARKAQAVGLRETHALFTQVLADDARVIGGTRPQALEFAADEIASALGISRRSAQIRLDDALDLTARPATLALLEAGVLAYPAARALAHETGRAPADLRAQVEARVLDVLGGEDLPGLGSMSTEQIQIAATLEPTAIWRVGQQATRARVIRLVQQTIADLAVDLPEPESHPELVDVEAFPVRPGTVMFGGEVSEADACTAWEHVHARARELKAHAGETRTMGQLRLQAFTDLITGRTPPAHPGHTGQQDDGGPGGPGAGPGDSGGPVQVNVTVTIDVTGRLASPRHGTLHSDTLRALMDAATDSGGSIRVKEVAAPPCPGQHATPTTDRHDPTPALDTAIRIRDKTCRFPGCTIPAGRADLDHTIPWPHGPTCQCNICALCRHHHRLKTHGRWRVVNHGDGRLTWTTPAGRTISTRPDP